MRTAHAIESLANFSAYRRLTSLPLALEQMVSRANLRLNLVWIHNILTPDWSLIAASVAEYAFLAHNLFTAQEVTWAARARMEVRARWQRKAPCRTDAPRCLLCCSMMRGNKTLRSRSLLVILLARWHLYASWIARAHKCTLRWAILDTCLSKVRLQVWI